MYKYSRFSYFKYSKVIFWDYPTRAILLANHSAGDTLIYVKEKRCICVSL